MNDYHDLYLEREVLLLAHVFEKFINNSLKVELELISDVDMYLFFEKGMRGGISYISKRYSQANNNYVKSYVPKQESKHIFYLDSNGLYGYAMSNFLPTCKFKWIDPKVKILI